MDVVPTTGFSHRFDADWCRDQGRQSTPLIANESRLVTHCGGSERPLRARHDNIAAKGLG